MVERIADRLGQRRFGRDLLQPLHQPGPECRHQRLRLGLADCNALLRRAASDARLNSIDLADPAQRLRSNRVFGLLVHVEELSPRMCQAIGERDRATAALRPGQLVIPAVAVHLQHAAEPVEMLVDVTPATILGVAIDHRRRRRPLPWSVVHRVAPQAGDPRAAPRPIEHRQRRVVAEHLWRRHDGLDQQLMQRFQPPRRASDPMHQGRTVEIDAVARQHLHLPVQRQVPGKLRHRDMGEQRRGRQAALDGTRRRSGLHHGALAGAAAIARATDAFDPDDCRDDVEHLADVLADAMQRALAARAGIDRGLDDDVLARQMLGQSADVADSPRTCRWRSRRWLRIVRFGLDRDR
jgi:hypothetical protein